MIDGRKIITICGSLKFKDDFLKVEQQLSSKNHIVLMPILLNEELKDISDEKLKILKEIHLKKIDLSDEIFVINKNGYLGQSTKNEIEYAIKNNKKVIFLEK